MHFRVLLPLQLIRSSSILSIMISINLINYDLKQPLLTHYKALLPLHIPQCFYNTTNMTTYMILNINFFQLSVTFLPLPCSYDVALQLSITFQLSIIFSVLTLTVIFTSSCAIWLHSTITSIRTQGVRIQADKEKKTIRAWRGLHNSELELPVAYRTALCSYSNVSIIFLSSGIILGDCTYYC